MESKHTFSFFDISFFFILDMRGKTNDHNHFIKFQQNSSRTENKSLLVKLSSNTLNLLKCTEKKRGKFFNLLGKFIQ